MIVMKVEEIGEVRASEVAKLFGVTARRVQQLTQDGIITPVSEGAGGKRYDICAVTQEYIAFLSGKSTGIGKKEQQLKESKLIAEVALKESQGELHRLKTEIAMGKYISVEVEVDYRKFFIMFKKFAMAIPNRVSGIINGTVDAVTLRSVEKEIAGEINRLLENFVVGNEKSADIGLKSSKTNKAASDRKKATSKRKKGSARLEKTVDKSGKR